MCICWLIQAAWFCCRFSSPYTIQGQQRLYYWYIQWMIILTIARYYCASKKFYRTVCDRTGVKTGPSYQWPRSISIHQHIAVWSSDRMMLNYYYYYYYRCMCKARFYLFVQDLVAWQTRKIKWTMCCRLIHWKTWKRCVNYNAASSSATQFILLFCWISIAGDKENESTNLEYPRYY